MISSPVALAPPFALLDIPSHSINLMVRIEGPLITSFGSLRENRAYHRSHIPQGTLLSSTIVQDVMICRHRPCFTSALSRPQIALSPQAKVFT